MDIEDKRTKKKTKLEDYGGVHNAPSSFFDESDDDKMFTSKFQLEMKNLSQHSDNGSDVHWIVNVEDADTPV